MLPGLRRRSALDLVAQAWQVMETIRPKYSCRTCNNHPGAGTR
ncbi:IS66 family transposase zinc-finger binding domain-containing protein [Mesorhizobium sp. L2C084A000]|nr:IS66 family transposase zinc-finger binding domain-containing protein [Mesorhizobium sp. L2C084A000]